MDYGSDRSRVAATNPPVYRNMQFENITGNGAPTAILIQGMPESPVANIRFVNLSITSKKGVVANFVKDLRFENVQVTPTNGPVFKLTDAANILIQNSIAPPDTKAFLQLDGKASRNVTLADCDLSNAAEKFVVGPEVKPEEVTIK
jgi:hypothetical protein